MLINRKLGEYVLLRRLAVGGQSEVFLAMKEGPGQFSRPVVIKALPTRYRHDPKFVELFQREAFLSARFSHPHVVTVHDARIIGGEHIMIMDFISGQTVADVAQRGYKRGKPPSLSHGVQIVADACDGLNYTHDFRDLDDRRYPVVHRDVSPQNLMVTYQGVTLVFDYGIAKIEGRNAEIDTLAGGKFAYMSPEQCLGEPVDTRSDIFSLGTILYELTVGTRLFRRSNKDAVIEAVTEEPIEPPREAAEDYPAMLEDIVMKALARDPDERYQTAGKMRDDLQDFLALKSDTSNRQTLGEYVTELFEDERAAVAEVIQRAEQLEARPEPVGSDCLEELAPDAADGESSDPAVPMPEPSSDEAFAEHVHEEDGDADDGQGANGAEAASEVRDEDQEPEAGTAEAFGESALDDEREGGEDLEEVEAWERMEAEEELKSLKRRQAVLWVAVALLAILAAGLGVFAYYGGAETGGEPVEIGVSE